MEIFDRIVLLLTGLVAIYLTWRFYTRYKREKNLYDIFYMLAFIVLLVSGLLLIFQGWDILEYPYVLTVASLIPLGISLGIVYEYFPQYKTLYTWFAVIGILAIAFTSISGSDLKKFAVPIFHGIAGLIIFLGPIKAQMDGKAPKGFFWVGIGGLLIGIGGIALAFLTSGSQLLFFSQEVVLTILAPLLLLMTLAFAWGFVKDVKASEAK